MRRCCEARRGKFSCLIQKKYDMIEQTSDEIGLGFSGVGRDVIDMIFYKNLYIGDTVKKPKKAIKKLKRHKKQPWLYVIAYDGETDRLTVYHSLMLLQWYYKKNPPACIVGIANGREEAFDVIEQIAQDALAATGEVSLVSYLAQTDSACFSARHQKVTAD